MLKAVCRIDLGSHVEVHLCPLGLLRAVLFLAVHMPWRGCLGDARAVAASSSCLCAPFHFALVSHVRVLSCWAPPSCWYAFFALILGHAGSTAPCRGILAFIDFASLDGAPSRIDALSC